MNRRVNNRQYGKNLHCTKIITDTHTNAQNRFHPILSVTVVVVVIVVVVVCLFVTHV